MNPIGGTAEILETGIETAGNAVATVAEKGTEVVGAVATVREQAASVVSPAAEGMLDTLAHVGGRSAVDPDQAFKALATLPVNLPSPAPDATTNLNVPTPTTPTLDTSENIPDVVDADGFRVISEDSAVATRPPSDVVPVRDGPLVPVHGDVVPAEEPVGAREGELPPTDENPYQPLFERVQPLSEEWTKAWGETSTQHLLDIVKLLESERVSRKANVIFAALGSEHVPLDRIVTSFLYALEPEEVDAFLTKVKAELGTSEGATNEQAEPSQTSNQAEASVQTLASLTENIPQPAQGEAALPASPPLPVAPGTLPHALPVGDTLMKAGDLVSSVGNVAAAIPVPAKP